MVVIQCPHCSLEVELDDGVSGLFDCPHCGEEFEWGEMDEEIDHERPTWQDLTSRERAIGGFTLFFGIILFFVMVYWVFPITACWKPLNPNCSVDAKRSEYWIRNSVFLFLAMAAAMWRAR